MSSFNISWIEASKNAKFKELARYLNALASRDCLLARGFCHWEGALLDENEDESAQWLDILREAHAEWCLKTHTNRRG